MRRTLELPNSGCKVGQIMNWLIIATVIAVILEPLRGNFLDLSKEGIHDDRLWLYTWYYSVAILMGVYAFYDYGWSRWKRDRYSLYLPIGILCLWGSILLGGAKFTPLSLIAPFLMVLTFHVFPGSYLGSHYCCSGRGNETLISVKSTASRRREVSLSTSPPTLATRSGAHSKTSLVILRLLMVTFSVLPLLALSVNLPFEVPFDLYYANSYRGFSASRTDYGYFVGITILTLMARPFRTSWVLILALFAGMVLSESRAALISIIVSVAYLQLSLWSERKTAKVWLVFSLVVLALLATTFGSEYYGRGVTLFEDSGSRQEILEASLKKASESMLFGSGAFYQSVYVWGDYWVEPHNSVLQSIINFGIIATSLWFAIIYKIYVVLYPVGRCFLLYWIIFGLFHPGFDAFLFVPLSFLALLLAIYFGSSPDRIAVAPRLFASSLKHGTKWATHANLTQGRAPLASEAVILS